MVLEPVVGRVEVVLLMLPDGQEWAPGEYEIGRLQFQLPAGTQPCPTDLQIVQTEVLRNEPVAMFQSLSGVVFVNDTA